MFCTLSSQVGSTLPLSVVWLSQHMPRLEVSLHEMPGRVNTGEVRRLVLELSNPSAATVKVRPRLIACHKHLVEKDA